MPAGPAPASPAPAREAPVVPRAEARPISPLTAAQPKPGEATAKPQAPAKPTVNLWLAEFLARPQMAHEWFACLVYSKIAEYFGNSTEGQFGTGTCWYVGVTPVESIDDPAFKGILLTEKRSLAFLCQGQVARFGNGVAFLGSQQDPLEGIHVVLLGVGLDAQWRVVFVLNEDFRRGFDAPEPVLTAVLKRLRDLGAIITTRSEILASPDSVEVIWTAPANQATQTEPEALAIWREDVEAQAGSTPANPGAQG